MVSVTTVLPTPGAPAAQDVSHPASPSATGAQGSASAAPQPSVGVEVELKVEVKRESPLDPEFEEGGQAMSVASCVSREVTGNFTTGFQGFVWFCLIYPISS